MASFRETVECIVSEQGESLESDFSVDIEAGEETVKTLSVERQGDVLIVCQYGTQRGDVMRDPAVRLHIQEELWKPIEYGNDYLSVSHSKPTLYCDILRKFITKQIILRA